MKPLHSSARGAIGRRALLQNTLASIALTAAAGMVRAAADKPDAGKVEIRNFAFVPERLTVPAGARVVWTNLDDEAHLVTSTDGAFKGSPALDTNDTFAMVFDRPGAYAYFCSLHPMMRGTIVVE